MARKEAESRASGTTAGASHDDADESRETRGDPSRSMNDADAREAPDPDSREMRTPEYRASIDEMEHGLRRDDREEYGEVF